MKPASTQTDKGLQFDGIGEGSKKGSNRFAGNKSGLTAKANYGRGSTVGNNGMCHDPIGGKSVTKDQSKRPPTSATPAVPKQGSVRDNINRGAQVRNPGGTRTWEPSKTQNYKGNPDSIRAGQTGGNNYGATSRGSRPVAAGQQDGINYGPKKQY